MAAPITVTSAPIKISSIAAKPYLITNLGNTPIYLGQDANVSQNNYAVLLGVGQGLNWQQINTEVWATTDTNKTTSVNIAYEAAGVFSSTVDAKVGNGPELLFSQTYVASVGSNIIPDIDISKYASVIVTISSNVTTVGTGLSLASGNYLQFSGIQSSVPLTAIGNVSYTNSAVWTFGDGVGAGLGLMAQIASYQFPVTNAYLTQSRFKPYNLAYTGALTATINIYGSYETITKEKYRNYPGFTGINANPNQGILFPLTNNSSTVAAPYSTVTQLPSSNGPVQVITASGTGAAGLTQVAYTLFFYNVALGAFDILGRVRQTTPATVFDFSNQTFTLPNAPIQIQPSITGTGNVSVTVIQQP